jgi:hypothetical protein
LQKTGDYKMWPIPPKNSLRNGFVGAVCCVLSGLVNAGTPEMALAPDTIRADATDLQTFQERTRQVKS